MGDDSEQILIVDDETNVRYSLETSLQSDELTVLTAGSARQGIERIRCQIMPGTSMFLLA